MAEYKGRRTLLAGVSLYFKNTRKDTNMCECTRMYMCTYIKHLDSLFVLGHFKYVVNT